MPPYFTQGRKWPPILVLEPLGVVVQLKPPPEVGGGVIKRTGGDALHPPLGVELDCVHLVRGGRQRDHTRRRDGVLHGGADLGVVGGRVQESWRGT